MGFASSFIYYIAAGAARQKSGFCVHIALFTPAWPLAQFHNGIVTYVHWMRRELERQGHKVSILAGVTGASDDSANVHLVQRSRVATAIRRFTHRRVPYEKDVFSWASVITRSILSIHRRHPIDIIEMEESFGWFAEVERLTGIPVLVKLHGPAFLSLVEEELQHPFGQERVFREGQALMAASAIASPSSDTLKQTLARYQLKPLVQAQVANPLGAMSELTRWTLDACDRNNLLFVGRFDRRKGGDIALKAFKLLLQQRPALMLTFVGPDIGLLQNDGTRIQFEEWSEATFSLEERRRIVYHGRLENHEIPALRIGAVVTLIPSRWENQGYAALEAMFQGCPIVASDVGGNPECIIHGRTGLLARNDDPVDFADKVGRLLDDPGEAAVMGSRAREHVERHHASEIIVHKSVALYRKVIAHHKRKSNC